MTPSLSVSHISKRYGNFVAVDDLSLEVPAGIIFGLLGPNGAGKTSALRMVMDITAPDAGEIIVLGERDRDKTRHRIGYLPEERGLYRRMRVADHLLFFAEVKGLDAKKVRPKIDAWLERFGLLSWRDAKVEDLSKGMQQKVQFIATLLHEPDLLILDEPFSGLDPVNVMLMREELGRYRDAGKTVIFCTHVMPQAERLCDEIVVIDHARKVIEGRLEEIKRRFARNSWRVVLRGDWNGVAELAGVTEVRDLGPVPGGGDVARSLEVSLAPGFSHTGFLSSALARFEIREFAPKEPDLEEIFVRVVSQGAVLRERAH